MSFPVNVKIKVKGSGQECPLHMIKTKVKVKGDGQSLALTLPKGVSVPHVLEHC